LAPLEKEAVVYHVPSTNSKENEKQLFLSVVKSCAALDGLLAPVTHKKLLPKTNIF
jgi:hypothetical protein